MGFVFDGVAGGRGSRTKAAAVIPEHSISGGRVSLSLRFRLRPALTVCN